MNDFVLRSLVLLLVSDIRRWGPGPSCFFCECLPAATVPLPHDKCHSRGPPGCPKQSRIEEEVAEVEVEVVVVLLVVVAAAVVVVVVVIVVIVVVVVVVVVVVLVLVVEVEVQVVVVVVGVVVVVVVVRAAPVAFVTV